MVAKIPPVLLKRLRRKEAHLKIRHPESQAPGKRMDCPQQHMVEDITPPTRCNWKVHSEVAPRRMRRPSDTAKAMFKTTSRNSRSKEG